MGDTFSWWWKTTASSALTKLTDVQELPLDTRTHGLRKASCKLLHRCGWKCPLRTSANNIHNEGKQETREGGWRWRRGWELKTEKQAEIHLMFGGRPGGHGEKGSGQLMMCCGCELPTFLSAMLQFYQKHQRKRRGKLTPSISASHVIDNVVFSRWISELF